MKNYVEIEGVIAFTPQQEITGAVRFKVATESKKTIMRNETPCTVKDIVWLTVIVWNKIPCEKTLRLEKGRKVLLEGRLINSYGDVIVEMTDIYTRRR